MVETAEFAGRVALLTGAATGIGRATALAFGTAGAKVVVADIDERAGRETVQIIRDGGGDATFVQVDVSQTGDVADMVGQALSAYGRIDMAHNNAGVEAAKATCHEISEEDWDRVIDINLKGVWLCMKQQIAVMVEQGGGAIVNTASTVGILAQPNMAAYVASKHGVIGLTKAAAIEYVDKNIRVNAVCPAVVATPMFDRYTKGDAALAAELESALPMKRLIEPHEVAAAVLWLSSKSASYLNGHALVIDGGLSIQ